MIVSQLSLLFFWTDGWYKCSWEIYMIILEDLLQKMNDPDVFLRFSWEKIRSSSNENGWTWFILSLNLRCSLSFSALVAIIWGFRRLALDLGDSPIMKHSARDSRWKPGDDLWLPAAWLEHIGTDWNAKRSKIISNGKWHGDGSKPWYLVNPKIAGKWMFIPLKMYL